MDEQPIAPSSLDRRFDELDRRIEDLEARMEGCRQAMLLSRGAIALGAAIPVFTLVLPGVSLSATIVVAAIAAVLGGLVWLGANQSTEIETSAALSVLNAQKAQLFDEVAARNGWRDLTSTVH